ncbi:methyltransferase domain-containing protein [bacterium]|nr:methyltransferase domain-containing protein [bacterium]
MVYCTDKIANGLMENYKTLFSPLQYKKIKLLEIGILEGESLRYWSDYFRHPETKIIGLDLNLPQVEFGDRIEVFECNQNDNERLSFIAEKHGHFDIIIDDGSHYRKETENCFRQLFSYLEVGGYYVIEDWAVGYWQDRPLYGGMVELINDIIAQIPKLSICESRLILEKNKALAFFRKGETGWSE